MKKVLTILAVALMTIAICSSCNKSKTAAKQTVKAVDALLDEVDDILDDFDKLTPRQKEDFVEYLVQQNWQETAGKVAKLSAKALRVAGSLEDMDALEETIEDAFSSSLFGYGKSKSRRHRHNDYDGYYNY